MKQKQNLILRIAQNGKITQRTLNGKDDFTVGRSPNNDVVLYGEEFPKRLRLFAATNSGYELRLTGNSRGEIVYDKSRLAFSDLVVHGLLPHHDGFPALRITPGKIGYLLLGDVRIDFAYNGAASATLQFDGFLPLRAFFKSLTQDPFFKVLVAALIILHGGLLHWASQREIKRPDQVFELERVQQRLARYIPKQTEEARPKLAANKTTAATTESKSEENADKSKGKTEARESTEKKGYGSDTAGEGVNLEKVGALALIGGIGTSAQSSNLMDALIRSDLAKGIDQVMASGKSLSAGRGKAGMETDVNALLAYGMLGEGKGGNSSIDDILKRDMTSTPAVTLEKTGKVSVEQIGKVSGSQEAIGARTEESLRQVLTQNMGRLQYLYNKYLKTNPDLRGKVEVEVTINADGTVANAVILSSEIAIPEFQREIVSAVRRWKYDTIAQGQMKVVYPILFVKVG
jgi:TonB family protein